VITGSGGDKESSKLDLGWHVHCALCSLGVDGGCSEKNVRQF
jgi:hypothetical protein